MESSDAIYIYIYIYIYSNTQVHLKKIFCSFFLKVKLSYILDSLHVK